MKHRLMFTVSQTLFLTICGVILGASAANHHHGHVPLRSLLLTAAIVGGAAVLMAVIAWKRAKGGQ